MSIIHFEAKLFKIGSWTILRLPESASAKLPSRGMTMIKGIINGFHFQMELEPDGKGSHWFRISQTMSDAAKINAGDTVTLEIEPTKEWLEPEIPSDLKEALATSKALGTWIEITTMARWDWIRWIRSTKQPETRKRRIENACAMLLKGKRRPCCFNRSLCTETYVSKNGQLIDPT